MPKKATNGYDLLDVDLIWFGDGSDGDATYTSGTVTLTRDTYFRNLTLSGSVAFDTAGYRLHVSGVLDISGLTNGYLGRVGAIGNDASSFTGATASTTLSAATIGSGPGGTAGAAGTTAIGTSTTGGSGVVGVGGASNAFPGAGGSGSNGSGGTLTATQILNPVTRYRRPVMDTLRGANNLTGAAVAAFGAPGGGGDGTNRGGGGGSGGVGGAVVCVFARTINRGASTAAGAIRAMGTRGGNGFAPTVGNCGGGGGGVGGSGGWVQIVYRFLTGSVALNATDVSAGNGGNGGSGVGTGTAGKGAGAGGGGYVSMFNLLTGETRIFLGQQSNTNPTGQTGETAAVSQTSL